MRKLTKLIFFLILLILFPYKSVQSSTIDSLKKLSKFSDKNLQSISKYSLRDVLDYQDSYNKSGVISYKFKDYNIWTIKDNLSLDGKERRVVTITQKKYSETINSYYIEYYQDGTIEFRKNSDPNDGNKNQWIISVHPEGINWYSQRQYFWKKDGGKEQIIGRWKSRKDNKWMYGVFEPTKDDPNVGLWPVFGYKKKDLNTETNLGKKERENLFKIAQIRSSEANEVFELLLKLQKKYYSKVAKGGNSNFVSKSFEKSNKIKIEENLKNTHGVESGDSQEDILKKIEQERILIAKEKAELEELRKKLLSDQNKKNNKNQIKTDEKYYALVVGNNDYKFLEKLDAAENDAVVIANVLEKKYGFEVELLLNADYDTTVNSLFNITRKLKRDDNLLIYYAGHGEIDKAENRGYWLPVDANDEMRSKWISNQRIVDRIKATKAKHVLLIADSCFSGTLMRSGTLTNKKENIDEKYIERLKNKKTRLVITSGGNEPVVDSVGGDHSLFALKLIETLKNNNKVINSQILFENIRRYVVSNADQTPERAMVHKTGHDGGDFLFFPK